MQEFLDFVLVFAVVYFITKFVIRVAIAYFRSKNEIVEHAVSSIIKDTFIFVKPEQHGDMIYLYETETGRFVAQGKNKEELAMNCKSRYPTKNVVMTDEDATGFNL